MSSSLYWKKSAAKHSMKSRKRDMPDRGRHRKAQPMTTSQNGTKADERFQKFSGSWSNKQEPQRRSGSGKEVLLNILSVEANGTGAISA